MARLMRDPAVPGFHLRPGGPARHDPFLFRDVLGHAPEGTSPAGLRPCQAGPAQPVGWVYLCGES
jgi:hypothetical protein